MDTRLMYGLGFLIAIFVLATSQALTLNADDFMPPASADSVEAAKAAEIVQKPEDVKKEKGFDYL